MQLDHSISYGDAGEPTATAVWMLEAKRFSHHHALPINDRARRLVEMP